LRLVGWEKSSWRQVVELVGIRVLCLRNDFAQARLAKPVSINSAGYLCNCLVLRPSTVHVAERIQIHEEDPGACQTDPLIAAFLVVGAALPSALLAQNTPGSPSPYSTLIDINFGAHLSPGLDANKLGLAAAGLTVTDFWSFDSRDDGQGH
jgi:hypothetical protein